ncbi:BrnT family toxin [Thalassotalea sp. G20_0]|uniref:BrnT family toxin n=1 Tax=Thalassotalea sp. G20_0 TaxID=2821093 RepID=UPI001ADB6B72|nr:BrnT family toxin [Thalassotalea sp. G20_0]MBO9497233.1 BrnT family toxin [Thalassotalea sp. G20_0]
MIDWSKVSGFDWDVGNERKNEDKHGVSKVEAEEVFFNKPLLVVEDKKHSQTESRYHALGRSFNNRLLHITFTLRAERTLIRVISARNMHQKERVFYEQNT